MKRKQAKPLRGIMRKRFTNPDRFTEGKKLDGWKGVKRADEPQAYHNSNDEGLSGWWRNSEQIGVKFVAQCKFHTAISDEPVDALNECVEAAKGKATQLLLYRCPSGTRVKKNEIICPKGHTPRLCGLTSTVCQFKHSKASALGNGAANALQGPATSFNGSSGVLTLGNKKNNAAGSAGPRRHVAKGRVDKKPDPRLSVGCPSCKAKAGHPCIRGNGQPTHHFHSARK